MFDKYCFICCQLDNEHRFAWELKSDDGKLESYI